MIMPQTNNPYGCYLYDTDSKYKRILNINDIMRMGIQKSCIYIDLPSCGGSVTSEGNLFFGTIKDAGIFCARINKEYFKREMVEEW